MRFAIIAVSMAALSAAPETARAGFAYNSLGGSENGGDPVAASGAGPILADRFFSGTSISRLTDVKLNLELGGTATGSISVGLFSDAGTTGPGTVLATLGTFKDSSANANFQVYDFSSFTPYTLAANTYYYLGITDNNGSQLLLGNTVDQGVLSRQSVMDGGYYYNNGGVQANSGGPYEMSISVNVVPEPASIAMTMLGGFAVAGFLWRRRKAG